MTLKRLTALLLTLCLAFALVLPTFAEDADDITDPCECGEVVQVFVRGFLRELYYDFGTENQREAFMLLHLLMNDQGESILEIDKHWQKSDIDDQDHEENPEYEFLYDYRMGAEETADQLREFIKYLRISTGHEKVALSGMSQGTSIVMTYVAKYGTDWLDTIILINGSYQGDVMLGELMVNHWGLSVPATINFIQSLLPPSAIVNALFDLWRKLPLADLKTPASGDVAGPIGKWLYNIFIMNLIGHMPAIWTFLPASYQAEALERLVGDKYKTLRDLANWYYDNVMDKIPDLLNAALDAGVKVAIISSYGKAPIPLTANATYQGDLIIDTANESGGATVAPYGETLGPNYIQKKNDCGDNHLSSDGIIDASTCMLPERTWFVKNNGHYYVPSEDLRQWIIHYDGQPTVWNNEMFPQFLSLTVDADGREGTEPMLDPPATQPANLSEAFANLLAALGL